LLDGAIKDTWGNLGRQKEKEMMIRKWISSDGSELVPTTDVKKKKEKNPPTKCRLWSGSLTPQQSLFKGTLSHPGVKFLIFVMLSFSLLMLSFILFDFGDQCLGVG
jgi:hypothetical protein